MPRRLLKKIIPDPASLKGRWFLRPFGDRLVDPQLWTLHRRGVTYAFGVGLAISFIPLPGHMLLACMIGVLFRLNIPVACAATFVVNPFTIVPLYYCAYRVGAALLQEPRHHFHFVPSLHWLRHGLDPRVAAVLARLPGVRDRHRLPRLAHPRMGLALAGTQPLPRAPPDAGRLRRLCAAATRG